MKQTRDFSEMCKERVIIPGQWKCAVQPSNAMEREGPSGTVSKTIMQQIIAGEISFFIIINDLQGHNTKAIAHHSIRIYFPREKDGFSESLQINVSPISLRMSTPNTQAFFVRQQVPMGIMYYHADYTRTGHMHVLHISREQGADSSTCLTQSFVPTESKVWVQKAQ